MNRQENEIKDLRQYTGHSTAITRKHPSVPVAWYQRHGMLTGYSLDYGCGHDLHTLTKKFDPVFHPRYDLLGSNKYDTIICNYVLNVIPTLHDRAQTVYSIRSFLRPGGTAYFAIHLHGGTEDEITGKGFQSGWSKYQWHTFLSEISTAQIIREAPFFCLAMKKD